GGIVPAVGSAAPSTPSVSGRPAAGAAPRPAAPENPPQTEAASPPAPVAIPIHYIPRASETAFAYLETIAAQLAATHPAAGVEEDLVAIDAALESLARRRSGVSVADARQGELSDWRQEYLRQDERLATIEARLEKRADEIQSRIEERGALADRW